MDVFIVVWGICAVLAAIIGSKKGRAFSGGLLVGLILGPLALVIALLAGPEPSATSTTTQARQRRMLARFHADRELPTPPPPRRMFATRRQLTLLLVLLGIMVIILSINIANDWPRLREEAQRQREAPPPPPEPPVSAADRAANRRITECLGTFRGPKHCFEEEQRRGERIEEMAEAIRRSGSR